MRFRKSALSAVSIAFSRAASAIAAAVLLFCSGQPARRPMHSTSWLRSLWLWPTLLPVVDVQQLQRPPPPSPSGLGGHALPQCGDLPVGASATAAQTQPSVQVRLELHNDVLLQFAQVGCLGRSVSTHTLKA